eukprot:scaffold478_cov254-Pinguiococcus_pyrenoidosus.AAC.6
MAIHPDRNEVVVVIGDAARARVKAVVPAFRSCVLEDSIPATAAVGVLCDVEQHAGAREGRESNLVDGQGNVVQRHVVALAAGWARWRTLSKGHPLPLVVEDDGALRDIDSGDACITAAAEGSVPTVVVVLVTVVVAVDRALITVPRAVVVGLGALTVPADAVASIRINAVAADLLHVHVATDAPLLGSTNIDGRVRVSHLPRVLVAQAAKKTVARGAKLVNCLLSAIVLGAAATAVRIRGQRGVLSWAVVVAGAEIPVPSGILVVEVGVGGGCEPVVSVPALIRALIRIEARATELEHVHHRAHMTSQAPAVLDGFVRILRAPQARHADFSIRRVATLKASGAFRRRTFGKLAAAAARKGTQFSGALGGTVDVGRARVPV